MKKSLMTILLLTLAFVLTACSDSANQQVEALEPQKIYQQAEVLIAESKYAAAAEKLDTIGSHEDATILSMYCKACDAAENGNYEVAIASFEALNSFKDSNLRALYYTARFYDESAKATELERLEQAKATYDSIPLFLDSVQRSAALNERIENAKLAIQYEKGVSAGESGDYAAAFSIFQELGDYQDAVQRIAYYQAREAEDALGHSTTDWALLAVADQYIAMGDYLDCKSKATALQNLAKWSWIDVSGWILSFEFIQNVSAMKYRDNSGEDKWGLIDTDGKIVMEPQWDELYWSEYSRTTDIGVIEIEEDNKRGFTDATGKIILPPEWDRIYVASEEILAVEKDGKTGFANISGQIISDPQWDILSSSWSNATYSFSEGLSAVRKGNKWGFIDTDGNIVLEPKWKSAENFFNGYAVVSNGSAYWYIDKAGNNAFDQTWDYCGNYIDGIAIVRLAKDQYCLINTKGEQISDVYDRISGISEGYARVCKNEKWGYIDSTGTLISEPQWDAVPYRYVDEYCDFRNGFARVIKDGKYGIIDTTGRIIVSPEWESVGGFYDGLSYVSRNGKYGFVNTAGDIVVEPIWDMAYNFYNGYAEIQIDGKAKTTQEREMDRGAIITYGDKKCGIIDTNGNIVIEPKWDRIDIMEDGYFIVTNEDMKRGALDHNGNIVIACDWDYVDYSGAELFTIEKDDQSGLMTSSGEIIFGFGNIGR